MAYRNVKSYSLGNGFAIECVTGEEQGEKYYTILVVIEDVPWRDIVARVEKLKNPDDANEVFTKMKEIYSKL